MTVLADSALRAAVWVTQVTPTPTPTVPGQYTGDEDLITPTWVGFVFTFLIAAVTVFLIIDMTRRVRRVRYRSEIQEKLRAEAENPDVSAAGVSESDETPEIPESSSNK